MSRSSRPRERASPSTSSAAASRWCARGGLMNRTMNVITRGLAPAALALALAGSPARAQDQVAGTPGEWLTRFTGARTLGLGGAYVALADDPLGVLWNPAGLSSMDENEL